jgi:multiple sugar transport system ATP-binding protein
MARVKLEGLRKIYENGFVAVHGAEFEVEDGEFVVLVGPSGCGKSTTLRMIAGLETITEGQLWIGDRIVNDVAPKDRDIAMVFQNYALYPHMSVYDNMAFGLKLRKYAKAEIDQRVKQAAEILGITEILDRKPKQLSGGQRQRVAVGRAIVRKPQVFLFDEPLSNLDAKLRVQMRTEISRLHTQLDATMIYVTHDQVEAMTMGDRIVVMKDGYIQQIDTPLNLYNRPANLFVAGFIGSPAMNFVRGRLVRDGGLTFRAESDTFALPLDESWSKILAEHVGKEVSLGIRPENIYVAGSPHIRTPVAEATLTLDVIEPMGNEIFLYSHSLEQALVARVAPQPTPAPGEPIQFAFDLTQLHFFDAETEARIGHEEALVAA